MNEDVPAGLYGFRPHECRDDRLLRLKGDRRYRLREGCGDCRPLGCINEEHAVDARVVQAYGKGINIPVYVGIAEDVDRVTVAPDVRKDGVEAGRCFGR